MVVETKFDFVLLKTIKDIFDVCQLLFNVLYVGVLSLEMLILSVFPKPCYLNIDGISFQSTMGEEIPWTDFFPFLIYYVNIRIPLIERIVFHEFNGIIHDGGQFLMKN